jgi:undecaprenyl-diphosphatase
MNEIILHPTVNWLVTFIASFLIWIMIFGFIVFYAIRKKIQKEIVFKIILSTFLAWLISELLKKIIPSIRPFKINGYSPLTITIPKGSSFPSSHTSAAFGLAISIFFYKPDLGFAFLLGALVVAAGRILANVHYIIDILGGIFIGGGVSYLVNRFYLKKTSKVKK